MSYEHVRVEIQSHVGRITLDRAAERNAMTLAMGREIERAVADLNAETSLRVVVVTGAGKAFSSGGNLKTLGKEAGLASEGSDLGGGETFYKSFLSIRDLRVPSIAAINGHAIGAGLCFAIACDLRVMHRDAKVGMTFVKLGIHPGMAATWNLPRLIGPSRAADLLYTGRLVGADEALTLGLVSRVAGDDFGSVVTATAEAIASNGPVAVRLLKETMRKTFDRTIDESVKREASAQAETFHTEDAREGLSAIMEKRSPVFRGR
jgi:enoyl-CoA hydratase/carnithine racemase